MAEPSRNQAELGRIAAHFEESARVKLATCKQASVELIAAADLIEQSFRNGGKLLICGNGGSAADSQHWAAEFLSRLTKDFERPALPAIALTTDTSFLTAFANDCGYEGGFARLVEALGRPGDVLAGISTSGNSANVIKAVELAKARGLKTIALIGAGGKLKTMVDVAISVPSTNTQHIQESHLAIEHLICELVERRLYGK